MRIFHIKGIKVSADKVFDLASKRLEALHAPFLKDMKNFAEQIDLILTRKALQYVKVCDKFQKPMKLEEQLKVAKEGQAFLNRRYR